VAAAGQPCPQSRVDTSTPVLVLGGGSHTSLSVIRGLNRAGVPTFTAGAGKSFVSYSRWHRRLDQWHGADPEPHSLATFLDRLSVARMVLLPCSDAWVPAVARLEPGLAARFPSSLPPLESLGVCLDKARLAEALAALGIPHPRTLRIDEDDDIRRVWDGRMARPFLKPRDSLAFQKRFGLKGVTVGSADEARAWVREARRAGLDLVLQEFVPGSASAHHFVDGFVDRGGAIRARMARRRVRTHPVPYGDSCCTESIRLEDARPMLEALDRLLPALGYRGIFNAQFKRDDRDGEYKLLDLNPRPWGSVSLTLGCGVDVLRMAYRDALGLAVEPAADYPAGRRWVYQPRDLFACWHLVRQGVWTPREWLRTWTGAEHPIWSRDDPVPAAVFAVCEARRLLARAIRPRAGAASPIGPAQAASR
jgi:predicted ATP-grasp superfamily ATP-dependent carboligase